MAGYRILTTFKVLDIEHIRTIQTAQMSYFQLPTCTDVVFLALGSSSQQISHYFYN